MTKEQLREFRSNYLLQKGLDAHDAYLVRNGKSLSFKGISIDKTAKELLLATLLELEDQYCELQVKKKVKQEVMVVCGISVQEMSSEELMASILVVEYNHFCLEASG